MKLLVVDECGYTCLGIAGYFTPNAFSSIKCASGLASALPLLASFKPTHILLNLTNACRHNLVDAQLQRFIDDSYYATLFIYLDTPYPYSDNPIRIADNAFLFSKSILSTALRTLRDEPVIPQENRTHSLFSPQELIVMRFWMAEMPNYRIARKLQISSHTVYVHKRHITEKIHVRNRLEFYSLYNVLRYFYPPAAPLHGAYLTQLAV
ncbi:TPA: LuxR family transcriptional regulator [Serratia odorifera]|nr:LuxR family transcriptional regulator [Serratia odorifera]